MKYLIITGGEEKESHICSVYYGMACVYTVMSEPNVYHELIITALVSNMRCLINSAIDFVQRRLKVKIRIEYVSASEVNDYLISRRESYTCVYINR